MLAAGQREGASPGLDAKSADTAGTAVLDPRLVLLLGESYRHAKAILGPADVLAAGGVPPTAAGVIARRDRVDALIEEMKSHRAWGRFPSAL